MAGGVDRLAHRGDVGERAGRGLVVDDADRLDLLRRVGAQARFELVGIDAAAPVRRLRQQRVAAGRAQDLDREAEARRHLLPERSELAGLDHQHRVARAQRVDERRFPRPCSGRRIDDDRLARLEHLADVGEDLLRERAELRAAMVDRRQAECAQDPVGHRARARNLQEVTAAGVEVEVEHDRFRDRCILAFRAEIRRFSDCRWSVGAAAIECRIDDHDDAAMLIDRPEHLAAPPGPKGTRLPDAEVLVELARRLGAETEGEVLFDAASRGRYATDASIYQIMPAGVLVPTSDRDVAIALDIARVAARARAAARRGNEPVRPDDRRRARDRCDEAPAPRALGRRRAPDARSSSRGSFSTSSTPR